MREFGVDACTYNGCENIGLYPITVLADFGLDFFVEITQKLCRDCRNQVAANTHYQDYAVYYDEYADWEYEEEQWFARTWNHFVAFLLNTSMKIPSWLIWAVLVLALGMVIGVLSVVVEAILAGG